MEQQCMFPGDIALYNAWLHSLSVGRYECTRDLVVSIHTTEGDKRGGQAATSHRAGVSRKVTTLSASAFDPDVVRGKYEDAECLPSVLAHEALHAVLPRISETVISNPEQSVKYDPEIKISTLKIRAAYYLEYINSDWPRDDPTQDWGGTENYVNWKVSQCIDC
jgi:hypothetical protein